MHAQPLPSHIHPMHPGGLCNPADGEVVMPKRTECRVAIDSALATIDRETFAVPDMALMRAKARALMIGYDRRWIEQKYTATAVEDIVTAELYNPETGARSRTFTLAGKIDVRGCLNDKVVVIDNPAHRFFQP